MTALLPKRPKPSLLEDAVRRDSAVHVSLSSDSLVKQPGTWRPRLPPYDFPSHLRPGLGARETREKPPKPAHPTWPWAGRMIHRANSEGLLKARHRIKRRRAKRTYIGFGRGHCQRLRTQNTRENASRIEQLKYRPGSHLWRRFYGHSHSARRTTATFLRRPLPHRVGSVAMRGRDDCQLSFGVPSGPAVLPVAITIGSR